MLTLVVIGALVLVGDLIWIFRYAHKVEPTQEHNPVPRRMYGVVVLLLSSVLYVLVLGIHVVG